MLLSGYLNVCLKLLRFLCKVSREKNRRLLTPLSHSIRTRGESVRLKAADVELIKRNIFYSNSLIILPSKEIAKDQHLKISHRSRHPPGIRGKNEYVLIYPQLGRDVSLRRKSHVSLFKLDS